MAAVMIALAVAGTHFLSERGEKLMSESLPETQETSSVKSYETLTDDRDGKTYRVITIGGRHWMAENLNHQTSGSWCYNGNYYNCEKYGSLYDWYKAINVCPSGWHLPTEAEWNELIMVAGGGEGAVARKLNAKVAGGGERAVARKLKAKEGWYGIFGNGTDAYGFSALPGGQCRNGGYFTDIDKTGFWWTKSESDNYGNDGYVRSIHSDNTMYETLLLKKDGFSVRCVQND
jgi:uncharacterized protein (TIGR02145 family)